MPIRVVELFRLGGFRMATRPGIVGLDWPEGFVLLEQYLVGLIAELEKMPYECLAKPRQEDFPPPAGPRYLDREGWVDLVLQRPGGDGSVGVFLRASLPFRWWPLARWVVWDGFRASRDGAVVRLSHEDLMEAW